MLITAVFMMRGRKTDDKPQAEVAQSEFKRIAFVAGEGLLVGAFTGLVGAGGGFLVVPALVLLGGLSMQNAGGTSLLVIAMKSFAGFAGYLSSTPINWSLAGMVTLAAVVGSFAGAKLAGKVPPDLLRKGFAWFVVVMAVFILSQEVPKAFGLNFNLAKNWPIELALLAVPVTAAVVSLSRGRPIGPPRPAAQ